MRTSFIVADPFLNFIRAGRFGKLGRPGGQNLLPPYQIRISHTIGPKFVKKCKSFKQHCGKIL